MAYLNSRDVIVFPLSKERAHAYITPAGDPIDINYTRLLTEKSISNISYQLMDRDGFVRSCEDLGDGKLSIEFNLLGYYFKITISPSSVYTKTAGTGSKLFACIKILDGTFEINGQDGSSDDGMQYTGLNIVTEEDDRSDYTASLHLLSYSTSTGWYVPTSSKVKFDISSLGITGIDGKYR